MIAAIAASGCKALNDFLDVKPTNKVSAEEVVSSPAGIQAFLANLYYRMPIEAFDFTAESKPNPEQGYRDGFHHNDGAPNNSARYVWLLTDDCTGPEVDDSQEAWNFVGQHHETEPLEEERQTEAWPDSEIQLKIIIVTSDGSEMIVSGPSLVIVW